MSNPMYRMRALSTTTMSSDDTSSSSETWFSTTTNNSPEPHYSGCRVSNATRYPSSDCEPHSEPTHRSYPKHVLIRARNINIPNTLRHHEKNSRSASIRRRQTQDDSDYELQPQSLQRVIRQKVKSIEQLEAEQRRMLQRKAELEDDPLLDASRMCPDRVWCIPCNKYIQIDSRRQFYATLWYKHRGKRHSDVPLKCLEPSNLDSQVDVGIEQRSDDLTDSTSPDIETPGALGAPLIDDILASSILAEMYSRAQGLRLLSLAAVALG